jgi:hypothetical protein
MMDKERGVCAGLGTTTLLDSVEEVSYGWCHLDVASKNSASVCHRQPAVRFGNSAMSPRLPKHLKVDKLQDSFISCSGPLAQWFTIRAMFLVRSQARPLCLNIPLYQLTRARSERNKGSW